MTAGFPDDATIKDLQRRLTVFFETRLPPNVDARDLVIDVLMALRSYRGESSLRGYAFGVARKRLVTHYRSRSREFDPLPDNDDLVLPASGPTTELDRGRLAATVRNEVDAIEPPYGEVVRLRLDGLDPPEIAKRIGVPYNTVRSRLARGLEQLRARLAAVLGSLN